MAVDVNLNSEGFVAKKKIENASLAIISAILL
jgi:hypothetical protein